MTLREVSKLSVVSEPHEIRLSELLVTLSLATDLGMGQASGWGLKACLFALKLAELGELSETQKKEVYDLSLLHYIGCTADSSLFAEVFGNDLETMQQFALRHMGMSDVLPQAPRLPQGASDTFRHSARARCEVASHLAAWCGFRSAVQAGLLQLFERWDGHGVPYGLKAEDLRLSVRIVQIAQDSVTFAKLAGAEGVRTLLGERSGSGYDPALADLAALHLDDLLNSLEPPSLTQAVIDAEPGVPRRFTRDECQRTLEAIADFTDIKAPYMVGHSREVAALAANAAQEAGLGEPRVRTVRWAGLLHDLGRVGVASALWDKPGPLFQSDWEQVRLHPYYTGRVLAPCFGLRDVARTASLHHERLDGSGYHVGAPAEMQPLEVRLLAAADSYRAMREPRPHRVALTAQEATQTLMDEVKQKRLDPFAVDCVLKAAGHAVKQRSRDFPGGLSPREVDVLRLVARGHANKAVAKALAISPKTVGHHLQSIYTKLGVSTRAAAALFAVQHHLVDP